MLTIVRRVNSGIVQSQAPALLPSLLADSNPIFWLDVSDDSPCIWDHALVPQASLGMMSEGSAWDMFCFA